MQVSQDKYQADSDYKNLQDPFDPDQIIHVEQEREVQDFALRWDVSPHDLIRAIERVGCRCADVERLLKAR